MSEEKLFAKIPYFDGNHYDHWSELTKNLLRAKDLWNLIEEPNAQAVEALSEAQRNQLNEKKQKDHKVKHYLFRAIYRSAFEQILDRRNSKFVWDSLSTKFDGNKRVKRTILNALRWDFEVLQMK